METTVQTVLNAYCNELNLFDSLALKHENVNKSEKPLKKVLQNRSVHS